LSVPKLGRASATNRGVVLVLNAVPGWGKTSCGAHAPEPFVIMAKGETGLLTLLGAGRVPAVDTVVGDDGSPRAVASWHELLAVVDALATTNYKNVVLDAMGGFERLCHEHVCARDFGGDWGEKGFGSFQKGYSASVPEWLGLLAKLERLADSGKNVVLLSHAQVRRFQNPAGPDFDRYISDAHEKTWAVTSKWCDAVLFGTFVTAVTGGKTGDRPVKGKGIGGSERVVYCEHRDSWDAKNRYGMPESIDIPNDHQAVWPTIWSHFSKGA
jgi:hypothetical protein